MPESDNPYILGETPPVKGGRGLGLRKTKGINLYLQGFTS